MTARRPCSVAPGPLEAYAREFDDLFGVLAQREGFRAYLTAFFTLHLRHRNNHLLDRPSRRFPEMRFVP